MINANQEIFLSEYFFFKVVCGKHLPSGELFDALCGVFTILDIERAPLKISAENATAESITTYAEYLQHCRVQLYSQITGLTRAIDRDGEEIVRLKGNTFILANSLNLIAPPDEPKSSLLARLSDAVADGCVAAMRVTGILRASGILLEKNERTALKNLIRAANWNDAVSLAALAYFAPENRARHMARLKAVTKNTPAYSIYVAAETKYGISENADIFSVKLLQRAFLTGIVKRDRYSPEHARILTGTALDIRDRERILLSGNDALLAAAGRLPLGLSLNGVRTDETGTLDSLPLKRDGEIKSIISAIENSDIRALPSYRPLCLCCDSEYVLDMYARAISSCGDGVCTERTDVAALSTYDLQPTAGNIFVRGIAEKKDNRHLLFFRGEIPQENTAMATEFLKSERRSKFHLSDPSVTLDLSAVLPICFTDRRNLNRLSPYCDVISLSPVTPTEFDAAIPNILAKKAREYGTETVEIDGKLDDICRSDGIDKLVAIIDAAVRKLRAKDRKITLTREILLSCKPHADRMKIGFGDDCDERN